MAPLDAAGGELRRHIDGGLGSLRETAASCGTHGGNARRLREAWRYESNQWRVFVLRSPLWVGVAESYLVEVKSHLCYTEVPLKPWAEPPYCNRVRHRIPRYVSVYQRFEDFAVTNRTNNETKLCTFASCCTSEALGVVVFTAQQPIEEPITARGNHIKGPDLIVRR